MINIGVTVRITAHSSGPGIDTFGMMGRIIKYDDECSKYRVKFSDGWNSYYSEDQFAVMYNEIVSEEKYASIGGGCCPVCVGRKIKHVGWKSSGRELNRKLSCSTCGSNWSDEYKLIGYCDIEYDGYPLDLNYNKVPIPSDKPIRLARPFEDLIKAVADVLECEKNWKVTITHDVFMREVMKLTSGSVNPSIVNEVVSRIFEERGL